jgi:hypothetical protein
VRVCARACVSRALFMRFSCMYRACVSCVSASAPQRIDEGDGDAGARGKPEEHRRERIKDQGSLFALECDWRATRQVAERAPHVGVDCDGDLLQRRLVVQGGHPRLRRQCVPEELPPIAARFVHVCVRQNSALKQIARNAPGPTELLPRAKRERDRGVDNSAIKLGRRISAKTEPRGVSGQLLLCCVRVVSCVCVRCMLTVHRK